MDPVTLAELAEATAQMRRWQKRFFATGPGREHDQALVQSKLFEKQVDNLLARYFAANPGEAISSEQAALWEW